MNAILNSYMKTADVDYTASRSAIQPVVDELVKLGWAIDEKADVVRMQRVIQITARRADGSTYTYPRSEQIERWLHRPVDALTTIPEAIASCAVKAIQHIEREKAVAAAIR